MKPNARPDTKEEARVYLTLDRAAHHPGLNPTALRQLIATGELQADAGLSISHPLYLEARTLLSQGRITVGLTGFEHVLDASGKWHLTGPFAPLGLVS